MPKTATPTFYEYSREFMAEYAPKKFSAGTIKNYESILSNWLVPKFGDLHLSSITPQMVKKFVDLELTGSTGQVNQAHIYHVLQRLLKEAYETYGYLPSPWILRVKGVGGDKSKPRPDWTLDDARKIIMFMPESMQDACRVAIGASLRIGELTGLNRGDWNPKTRALSIERQYRDGQLKAPKMGSAGIVYPILGVSPILDELIAAKAPWSSKDDALFRGERGARLHPTLMRAAWSRARGEAYKAFHVHDLRGVGLTEYARREGVTLQDILDHGRHKDVKAAMRYQKSSEPDRRRMLSQDGEAA